MRQIIVYWYWSMPRYRHSFGNAHETSAFMSHSISNPTHPVAASGAWVSCFSEATKYFFLDYGYRWPIFANPLELVLPLLGYRFRINRSHCTVYRQADYLTHVIVGGCLTTLSNLQIPELHCALSTDTCFHHYCRSYWYLYQAGPLASKNFTISQRRGIHSRSDTMRSYIRGWIVMLLAVSGRHFPQTRMQYRASTPKWGRALYVSLLVYDTSWALATKFIKARNHRHEKDAIHLRDLRHQRNPTHHVPIASNSTVVFIL